MSDVQITWKEKISENQQFRSTWKVEIDGKEYIAKKIETDNDKKLESLVKRLKQQIRFSEILNEDEQKKICLFEASYDGDGYVAFVRRFLDGSSLDKCLASKRYTVSDAVGLILEIARIVQIAHEHKVFHGDLKPANIIIGENGEVAIIDWDTMRISDGVKAELIGSDVTVDQTSGTPQYMPVEQFQGEKISPQNDIYALGVILYQILTGETPFDSVGAQTPAQLAIYKQNHEPDSILVKYPALGIPADLGKIIDEALKNDLNQRIQTVDVFIQRLETIGKITASSAGTQTSAAQKQTYVQPKEKGKEHKLVLIGHTGAGKTVMAAGLYATQDRDFAVDDPGSKTQTGIHAINTKTIIEEGHWPAATSIGDITNLKFKISYKGKEEAISFDEYAGERLEMENFDNAIVKDPDGAFILVNPGGKQWHDIHSKNSLLSDLKHYIDLLSKKLNHPPIALVITASDRLESDLREFAPKFQTYVNELDQYLAKKKCVYKIFKGTISGVLENQDRPHLNPQHIKDPFIWLLERFTSRERKKIAVKTSIISAIIAAALLLGWGANWGREYHKVTSFHGQFIRYQKEFNAKGTKSEDDLIAYRKNLIELRNSVCAHKHFATTQRQGKCSKECRPLFFMSSLAAKFDLELAKLEQEIDAVNAMYFRRTLDKAIATANEENRKVVEWIKNWQPLKDDGIAAKAELKSECDAKMPLAIERFDTKQLRRKLQELAQNPPILFPRTVLENYEKWVAIKSVLPQDERAGNFSAMKELLQEAKVAVENKHYATLLETLENIKETFPADIQKQIEAWQQHETCFTAQERAEKDEKIESAFQRAATRVFDYNIAVQTRKITDFNGTADDLVSLINGLKSFKEQPVVKIDPGIVSQKHSELDSELEKTVYRFIKNEQAKAQKKQMGSDPYSVPTYAAVVKQKIAPLFSERTAQSIIRSVDQFVTAGKSEWLQDRKKVIDGFITKIQYSSASSALDELKGFYMENRDNPYIKYAETKVLNISMTELRKILEDFKYTERDFLRLKEFSAPVRSTQSPVIQSSPLYKFANRYFAWMDSNPCYTISIHGVEASTTFKEGAYIKNSDYAVALCGSEGQSVSPCHSLLRGNESVFYGNWKTIIGSFNVQCAPWQFMVIDFLPYENIEWAFDTELKYRKVRIYPGKERNFLTFEGDVINKNGSYAEISFSNISLRIYFSISGETLSEIIREAFK